MANPLVELGKAGQSIWYDQMERALLSTGSLSAMIERDDLRGLTSNPTIFEKAIGGSHDYDEALEALARKGADRDAVYEALVLDDIGRAADLFDPVWERNAGQDGFVSLEVSPLLANDTAATIEEGLRLFAELGRRNVMIKVPATPAGIPAIEELIAAGVNVNVTLIFARAVYGQVIEAYLKGLERRAAKGEPIDRLASVASFFVSRIDTKADSRLKEKIAAASDPGEKAKLESLLGKTAIANAKLAYQLFLEKFSGPRWEALRARGARVQRPLWASTGTKDPAYSDVLYVESLIGPDTVNTIPPKTYDAFKDHGVVRETLTADVEHARKTLEALEGAGVSLDAITAELTREGVKSFADSFESLMNTIEARREATMRAASGRETESLGKYQGAVDEALAGLKSGSILSKIHRRDASVWKSDAENRQIIDNSLGWIGVPEWSLGQLPAVLAFADEVRKEFDHVVVLGMGGSSLCAEVLRTTFGRRAGWPVLHVLDSTVPAAVRGLEEALDLRKTLFIVASKSGTTTEPVMFQRYFWGRIQEIRGKEAGSHFIAITDKGTALFDEAGRDRYRMTFVNPADIGGRYSALSLFGIVPAALAGIDVTELLRRAIAAARACSDAVPPEDNPAARLGAALGALARQGRDKVTIVASPPLAAVGLWIEQLVAESTGKEGKGILPIAQEPLSGPAVYGSDRVFVRIRVANDDDEAEGAQLRKLSAEGHPTMERVLRDPLDLGDEFYVWEMATAIAGHLLQINPFDQPNVQESKDNTRRLLETWRKEKSLPGPQKLAGDAVMTVSGDAQWGVGGSPADSVAAILSAAGAGDYVALLLYIRETPERNEAVRQIRAALMSRFQVATTAGYGPRFLHSTGQLHKGGSANGVFLQITADEGEDVAIPGEPFGFRVLSAAQAQGDFEALSSKGRRALRVHLSDVDRGLGVIRQAMEQAAPAGRM